MAGKRYKPRATSVTNAAVALSRMLPAALERLEMELGDPEKGLSAARTVMDLCLPKVKPQSMALDVKLSLDGAMTTADYARAIESHLMAGEISVSLANDGLAALANVAKIVESTELLARLEALEELALLK
jgi:hypothetical protein